ncbi:hypothetical protein OCS_05542 [Ophiocordyceps sinensis CO18]|uniref:Uncharacterized protein n=1 Tax=Ophiocordyceps sinensis (strain Co18 / CGMCC 3.14243) TaxID=911162 RepID=T5A842_OPHSC|nr:hypothetical protein OCS_05542 [Ophiocordyceps sinensis CO18]
MSFTTKLESSSEGSELGCRQYPPLDFYLELTKLHLTRKALDMLDVTNRHLDYTMDRPPVVTAADEVDAASFTAIPPDLMDDDLRTFAENGGPDLSDLMAYRNQWLNPRHKWDLPNSKSDRAIQSWGPYGKANSIATRITSASRATGPWDVNFQQHLYDHGIFCDGAFDDCLDKCPEPNNIESVKAAVLMSRPTELDCPSVKEYFRQRFVATLGSACTKAQVLQHVVPIIEGPAEGLHPAASGISFTNLEPLTSSTIAAGQPDMFYGSPPERVQAALRDELFNLIVPAVGDGVPVAPNFFACYHGALGARGMHNLKSHSSYPYKEPGPKYDDNAYTLTSVLFGGRLDMYAMHVTAPAANPSLTPCYIMTPIGSWCMDQSDDALGQGISAWRNGREWAQRTRQEALDLAYYLAFMA